MPERWQDELRRLRHERMPEAVRERVDRGPQRELPSGVRQRVVAGLVAFAVFIAAGAFAWRAFDGGDVPGSLPTPTPAAPVVLAIDSNGGDPTASLSFERSTQPGLQSAFEWCGAGQGCVASTVASRERPTPPRLAIRVGAVLALRGDADSVEVQTSAVDRTGAQVSSIGGGDRLEAPGRYLWKVHATWDEGSADFRFTVEVVGQSDIVSLHLLDQANGPVALISYGDQTREGFRESYGWCTEGDCSGADSDYGYSPAAGDLLPVGPDALFLPDGSGELTRLVVRTFDGATTVMSDSDGAGVRTPTEPGRYTVWISARWSDHGHGTFVFAIEVEPANDEITDVLHLTCTPETASLDANVVRTQPDGVHLIVDASDDVRGVEIITGPDARELSGVGFPLEGHGSRGIPIEPGRWHVGCYGGGDPGTGTSDIGTERTASFTVVDPEDHYTPVDLVCEEPTTRLFAAAGTPSSGVPGAYEASPMTVEQSAAAVPGILPTDAVREAGYVDGPGFKMGPIYSVLRDGAAIARLHVPVEVSSTWGVSVDACPGSGVGPDAPPGAAGPTPDTAVVRCLESRIEIATPVVNTQPDGLHIALENAGGSQRLVVVAVGERTRVFSFPIGTGPASLVVPANPGGIQLACRSNAETAGTEDPFLDRRSGGLHLQDRSGYFVPYAPTCDSSDEVPIAPPTSVSLPKSAGEWLIRENLAVLDSDIVERAGYLVGRGDDGPWRVQRDGQIVAQIEYPSLEGITCRGAGITGT
jgi:hypothetical protein